MGGRLSKLARQMMEPLRKKKTKTKKLRILCFGNSLTAGFPADHPYALKLRKELERENKRDGGGLLPPGTDGVECVVEGLPGDLVTRGTFIERMEIAWHLAEEPFDWTIVLGGTNDLGWGVQPEQVIEGLKRTWDIPLSKGGKVLALTIPETKSQAEPLVARRRVINEAIQSYEKTGFFHFDLHAALPRHSLPPDERARLWEPDGVHLKAAGYDEMGTLIAGALTRILRLADAAATELRHADDDDGAPPGASGRDRKEEEELGDPRLLSQGYIVVRRSDLE
ncbi:GDSL-like Lipase/Acylhydrolase [Xylariaceae sp. FL0804]|nr:GDSL-like Lipase/Acylhydrolase [Xylariaceae sp. FL0804]